MFQTTIPLEHRDDVMQLSHFDYLRRSVEALISGAALALQVADGKRFLRQGGAPVRLAKLVYNANKSDWWELYLQLMDVTINI